MRLFTGIAIASDVLEHLARMLKELRPLAQANWSPVENLHITAKFIGEWPEARLPELEAALERMQPVNAFAVTIAGFGYFPNPHHPHTFFAGVKAGPELAALAKRIDEALAPLGIKREDRPYSPHLTLARMKHGNAGKLREHIAALSMTSTNHLDFGTFDASEFHLYLSRTEPSGPVYTRLATYELPMAAGITSTGPRA